MQIKVVAICCTVLINVTFNKQTKKTGIQRDQLVFPLFNHWSIIILFL